MEQRAVVPIYSESAGYREWELKIGGAIYTMIDDNGDWALLRAQGDEWEWAGDEKAVNTFLHQHGLVLGN